MQNSPERTLFPVPVRELAKMSCKYLPLEYHSHYQDYQQHLAAEDWVACDALKNQVLYLRDLSPDVFARLYQMFSWHSKITALSLNKAQNQSALVKFYRMERRCAATNRRIQFYARYPFRTDKKTGIENFWGKLRQEVHKILGPLTANVYNNICRRGRFGPGMTLSSVDVEKTSIPRKLIDEITTTAGALPVFRDFAAGCQGPWWSPVVTNDGFLRVEISARVVTSNRVGFVPKDNLTSRVITIEPSANMYCQLGIHDYITDRLTKLGNSIRDQNRNRQMALIGSKTGEYATVDLSSASDTVAKELVKQVVRSDWATLLFAVRSPSGEVDGKTIAYEKFSSMGNGTTFALETVLFYAIARTVCEGIDLKNISVYGDDIIIPTTHYARLVRVLRFLGFIPNAAKCFVSGPFRESCGLDGYLGVDVRPVMIRGASLEILPYIDLHNRLYRKGYLDLCQVMVQHFPAELRLFGPPGPIDRGFFFTEDPSLSMETRYYNVDQQVTYYRAWKTKVRNERLRADLLLLATLFSGGSYSKGAPLRGRTKLVRCWSHS